VTWFKVDDKLHSHRKVAALGTDVGAMALWVVAGSWSADHLTDGFIPRYIVPTLLPVSKARALRFAEALERVGLWDAVNHPDSKMNHPDAKMVQTATRNVRDLESGWQFHGWNERGRQPTSAQVLADREANADRVSAFRERQKTKRNAVTNGVTNGVRNEAPTRPDPVLPTEVLQQRAGAREIAPGGNIPVWAIPLVDTLTAQGHVVSWDLGLVDWDRVRVAIDKSGIPAMVAHVGKRAATAKTQAYSARAWVRDWSMLPALSVGAALEPLPQLPLDNELGGDAHMQRFLARHAGDPS
jgi:hypothetical protein